MENYLHAEAIQQQEKTVLGSTQCLRRRQNRPEEKREKSHKHSQTFTLGVSSHQAAAGSCPCTVTTVSLVLHLACVDHEHRGIPKEAAPFLKQF